MRRPLVVVMGVSGVGKTAVGLELAERVRVEYADGDDFHPQANVEKMRSGTPLTNADRGPWLRAVAGWLADHDGAGGVMSCSALRRAYRQVLVAAAPRTSFLHLTGDLELIRSRMQGRVHFMPVDLLQSQLEALEPLGEDEDGVALPVTASPAEIVTAYLTAYRAAATSRRGGPERSGGG